MNCGDGLCVKSESFGFSSASHSSSLAVTDYPFPDDPKSSASYLDDHAIAKYLLKTVDLGCVPIHKASGYKLSLEKLTEERKDTGDK